jgi:hypothetical protein
MSAVILLFFALILEMGKEKQGKTRKNKEKAQNVRYNKQLQC